MRRADIISGTKKLHVARQALREAWEAAQETWDDPAAAAFEEDFLRPLHPLVSASLESMGRIGELLARAERDCDSRESSGDR